MFSHQSVAARLLPAHQPGPETRPAHVVPQRRDKCPGPLDRTRPRIPSTATDVSAQPHEARYGTPRPSGETRLRSSAPGDHQGPRTRRDREKHDHLQIRRRRAAHRHRRLGDRCFRQSREDREDAQDVAFQLRSTPDVFDLDAIQKREPARFPRRRRADGRREQKGERAAQRGDEPLDGLRLVVLDHPAR